MKNTEYRTINADLSASLITYGLPCRLETFDGFQIEFVFRADGDGIHTTQEIADRWSDPGFPVDSKAMASNARKVRIAMRKIKELYGKQRVPTKLEYVP